MKIKHYKKYSDVPQKYRFDLEDILENKTIEQLIKEFFDLYRHEIKIKDSNTGKRYMVVIYESKVTDRNSMQVLEIEE